ncbi:MAG: hypothetical protein MJ252_09620 [archaeon]|nr:hypothetical protein [archaeon]
MTFEEMVLKLKECGILICPEEYDIREAKRKVKDQETVTRAIEDIVMASRYYSIRAHDYNRFLEPEMIAVKAKPNPEGDRYFFDDEEKDWTSFVWYPNKASIGKINLKEEGDVEFVPSIEVTRPHLHLVLKDTQPEDVYRQVAEDDFSATFLINLRNFIRVIGIVHIP